MHRVKDLLLGIFPELPLNLVRMLVTCATIAIDVGSLQGLKVSGGELGNGVQVESQGTVRKGIDEGGFGADLGFNLPVDDFLDGNNRDMMGCNSGLNLAMRCAIYKKVKPERACRTR